MENQGISMMVERSDFYYSHHKSFLKGFTWLQNLRYNQTYISEYL